MMMLLQAELAPVFGLWGYLLLGFFLLASATANIILIWKRGGLQAATDTIKLYESELTIVRERAERLHTDSEAKSKRIGVLEARTDLDSLRSQVVALEKIITRETSESQLRVVTAIQQMSRDMMEGFMKHSEDERRFQERVCGILDRIEARADNALTATH